MPSLSRPRLGTRFAARPVGAVTQGIDVFVEVMGASPPRKRASSVPSRAVSSVVTANKMLLALHRPALIEKALARGVDLAFEGSVGGGIPVVRVLRDAFASDRILALTGIVNGTSNYILTAMSQTGMTFDAALRDAQAKGYAEADPTLDVGGHEAAHKLAILGLVAFGARVPDGSIFTEGVDTIEAVDHVFAAGVGDAKRIREGGTLPWATESCFWAEPAPSSVLAARPTT